MVAYRHEEYGTGTTRSRAFYVLMAMFAGALGGGLALLTWS